MKAAEFRAMNDEDLLDRVDQLLKELFEFQRQNVTKELENVSRIRETKREIARAKTVLRERNILV